VDKARGSERRRAMKKLWSPLGKLMDFFDIMVLVLLFTALAFSVGYQVGFTAGLDTKVTLVGEKYTMLLKGNSKR
jgi:hypothetical protein